ncbi:uncharacterized protein LOC119401430 [Rhipicephalus sanguineus]|uniref:uncharacterized protein LOC119401430 n=1 Tax=Rhipicephalus sanguineus TaxID=34632 RepID=UPI0018950372|nr:uncharacterized protein LOC119401430 [Rhipicephalus sanguineus]
MLLTQAVGLLVVFAVYAAHAEETTTKPYEDDPSHSSEQDISKAAEVTDNWVVKRRNIPSTGYSCHSATRLSGDGTTYKYKFSVRNDTTQQLITWEVDMTTKTTDGHEKPNAVSYKYLNEQLYPGAPTLVSKLMTEDLDGGCALFVTPFQFPGVGEYKVCMLVMKKSKVTGGIPEKCESVYSEHCPHLVPEEDEPWKTDCQ